MKTAIVSVILILEVALAVLNILGHGWAFNVLKAWTFVVTPLILLVFVSHSVAAPVPVAPPRSDKRIACTSAGDVLVGLLLAAPGHVGLAALWLMSAIVNLWINELAKRRWDERAGADE